MFPRVLLILAFIAGLAGCGRDPPPAAAVPSPSVAGAPGPGNRAPADAPRQLGLCASCHGRTGVAVAAGAPSLAGRDRSELLDAMQAYLDGRRDYAPMRAMLGPIGPADRARLADWFAAQPPPADKTPP